MKTHVNGKLVYVNYRDAELISGKTRPTFEQAAKREFDPIRTVKTHRKTLYCLDDLPKFKLNVASRIDMLRGIYTCIKYLQPDLSVPERYKVLDSVSVEYNLATSEDIKVLEKYEVF